VGEAWKDQAIEKINKQLGEEGIPPVKESIFKWRMRKAFRDQKYEGM